MGTKFECDVEGCENTHDHAGRGGMGPMGTPPGWSEVTTGRKLSDLEKKGNRPRPVLRRMRMSFLVCPKHQLPTFKPIPENLYDEVEEHGYFMSDGDDDLLGD